MIWLSHIERKLIHSFWFLPPDIHERQRFIASRLPSKITVLDVGGEQPILQQHSQVQQYYTINIAEEINQTPDYIKNLKTHMFYDGKHLPFEDVRFDVVVCIDVLEHVPPEARTALIEEMLRVTKKKLICSAPLGTKEHIQAEKDLYAEIQDSEEASFLNDHIEKGLPTPQAVEEWRETFSGTTWYSGDFRWSMLLYQAQRSELQLPVLNHAYLFLKLLLYFCCNVFLYPLIVNHKKHNPYTNRFYLEITKES